MNLMALKSRANCRSICVINCYLKVSAVTAVKRDAKFEIRSVKLIPFVKRR